MTTDERTVRCAARLQQQWPRVDRSDLEHLADALRAEARWKDLEPAEAAVQWLRQRTPEAQPLAHAGKSIQAIGRLRPARSS
ncbi:MAG: hypothetical protein ABIP61_05480 [Burkholderiaceae bacterium]